VQALAGARALLRLWGSRVGLHGLVAAADGAGDTQGACYATADRGASWINSNSAAPFPVTILDSTADVVQSLRHT
jgi:hypothetical protein